MACVVSPLCWALVEDDKFGQLLQSMDDEGGPLDRVENKARIGRRPATRSHRQSTRVFGIPGNSIRSKDVIRGSWPYY